MCGQVHPPQPVRARYASTSATPPRGRPPCRHLGTRLDAPVDVPRADVPHAMPSRCAHLRAHRRAIALVGAERCPHHGPNCHIFLRGDVRVCKGNRDKVKKLQKRRWDTALARKRCTLNPARRGGRWGRLRRGYQPTKAGECAVFTTLFSCHAGFPSVPDHARLTHAKGYLRYRRRSLPRRLCLPRALTRKTIAAAVRHHCLQSLRPSGAGCVDALPTPKPSLTPDEGQGACCVPRIGSRATQRRGRRIDRVASPVLRRPPHSESCTTQRPACRVFRPMKDSKSYPPCSA